VAAERLFAEHGLDNVSHRQISAAAGQRNIAAVNYHFGTTEELILEIVRRNARRIERFRVEALESIGDGANLRDWIGCLVYPVTRHLDEMGSPTWYARLGARVATDPRYQDAIDELAVQSPALRRTIEGIRSCLPDLPEATRAERSAMARLITVHMLADREAALAAGRPTARATWAACGAGMVDALAGLWSAPVGPGTDH
jgi:AcrR family transcriptional regulator